MADYTEMQIVEALKLAGVKSGDSVFSHSNVAFFGIPECDLTYEAIYQMWKRAFLSVLGPEGTLVMPTFSYTFCRKKVYDPLTTPGDCGVLSEMMRQDPEAVRSEDANFSIVAIGKNAKHFTENSPEHSFGKDCFFERFYSAGGLFVNLNVHPASTFIHYVECMSKVPYRWHKPFPGEILLNGKLYKRQYYHFVYDLEKSEHRPDFSKFNNIAEECGIARSVALGRGKVVAISAEDTRKIIVEQLEKDISFLIKGTYNG